MEGIWLDYHYLDSWNDFKVDPWNWDGLKEYTQDLKKWGKNVIALVRTGLNQNAWETTYAEDAKNANCLVWNSVTDEPLAGNQAYSSTVFLDFFNA